jgi:hypothetical protein
VSPRRCLPALAAAALAGGCVADLNERLALGTRPTPTFGGGHGPGMGTPGTLDRSRWRTLVVVAPIDGVVHADPFRTEPWASRTAGPRRAGVFPFDAPRLEPTDDAAETLREYGRAAFDPLLAPIRGVRSVRAGVWTWSPVRVWKRTPSARSRPATVGGRRDRTAQRPGEPADE